MLTDTGTHTCTAAAASWQVASAVAFCSALGLLGEKREPVLRSTAQASFMLPACKPTAPATH